MKILNGTELAEFIKERQARQVRRLRQAENIAPKLAIIKTLNDPVIELYVGLKQRYGDEIGIDVEVIHCKTDQVRSVIKTFNEDANTHGIIVQLPLADTSITEEVLNSVSVLKDVDGLAQDSSFTPATPTAIQWLLNGYNINLSGKRIVIVGKGRLVGLPLSALLESQGFDVTTIDEEVNVSEELPNYDVVISATGSPGLIQSNMLKESAIAVDAGVTSEDGKTSGDFEDSVYERDDLTITPKKGGVGPLTVCALFENVILAANRVASEQTQPPA